MTGVAGEKAKRTPGPRMQHVIAHRTDPNMTTFDEVLVFGQEIDALRAILGKPDWVYAAVQHGASFVAALRDPIEDAFGVPANTKGPTP